VYKRQFIVRALDQNGKPIFNLSQKSEFLAARGMVDILTRVIDQIVEIDNDWGAPDDSDYPPGS
jgi:hypothetical protein